MKLKTDERAVFALRALYGGYGYSQYKMSKFEEYDLYVRNKNFLISDNIITFTVCLLYHIIIEFVQRNSGEIWIIFQKIWTLSKLGNDGSFG